MRRENARDLRMPGGIDGRALYASAEYIASQQRPDGGLPWFAGGMLDPWDHVESAMALSVMGLTREAEAAYEFSAATQREDGSWPMEIRGDEVVEAAGDTNQAAYLAVGVWHHFRITGDREFLRRMWPTVRAAIDFVVAAQLPGGELAWAVTPAGVPDTYALLTGSASALQALDCACHIALELGVEPLAWRSATARLAHALRYHPESFADRSRFSMDWYYPVLGGALRGQAAHHHLAREWGDFVEPGWGARCVSDRPWFTVAESCELVLSLDAVGDSARAHRVFADVQHLRHTDGGYWTGYVPPDSAIWPEERTTWTAAAVVLAADALALGTSGAGIFRDVRIADSGPTAECGCDDRRPRGAAVQAGGH